MSTLILGPRQVGKSSLCRALHPDRTIDLASESVFLSYAKNPGRLAEELTLITQPSLVFIDEVQRVPALLNVVQTLLDRPGNTLRFLLTGSSARKLKRGQANLLPGRIILEYLDPLAVAELGSEVDLDRALRLGMLPGIYLGDAEAAAVLETYAAVYLKEEIQAEALTRNIGDFARFLDIAALASGQWLNYSKLSLDTEIPKETIRRFVTLLEDTLITFVLPPFRPRHKITRRLTQRSRLLFFDIGVRNALLGLHRHPITPDQVGSVFEQWFMLQVIYLNRGMRKGWAISSYRTEAGAEVDLVIERSDDIIGVEIKSGRNVGRSDIRGFTSLQTALGRYKPLKKYVVCQAAEPRLIDSQVEAWPYMALLEKLRHEA